MRSAALLVRPFLLVLLIPTAVAGQPKAVRDYTTDHQVRHRWLMEYTEFLSIPNVYGDSVNIYRNAVKIQAMLGSRGIRSELLHAGIRGASPVVFGEVLRPGATTTIVFYAHYDGQPVNPQQWAKGIAPFKPVLLNERLDKGGQIIPFPKVGDAISPAWRLYGRGSSDDKAGVFAIIAAYEALTRTGKKPTVNVKFFFEGEEEAGSINLARIFQLYTDKLKGDLWIISDGPRHTSGKKQVVFGVRGDINVDLKVYGAKRPLHSGNYGNWAPNPAQRLAELLASMKDDKGMVTINGFYDDVIPLSAAEKKALQSIPDVEATLKEDLLLPNPDGGGKPFQELLTLPTLNINGMSSGNVGAMASNIIPTEATAVLDLRMVAGNDVDKQVDRLIRHIQLQGYHVIDHEPTEEERKQHPLLAMVRKRKGGYNAQRTPMDSPLAQKAVAAVQHTVDYPVVQVPSLGGSLPLFLFEQYLDTKPITVPVVNYDNNQHAENENVMLQYLWEGVETMAALMMME